MNSDCESRPAASEATDEPLVCGNKQIHITSDLFRNVGDISDKPSLLTVRCGLFGH